MDVYNVFPVQTPGSDLVVIWHLNPPARTVFVSHIETA
jgi:hypothetical protein